MNILKLEMSLYGDRKYKVMYIINKEPDEYNRIIKSFYYEIDSSNYIISTLEEDHYKIHKIINGNKEEFNVLTIPYELQDLISPNKLSFPILYNYKTAIKKDNDTFSIKINLPNNTNIELSFDKYYYVSYEKESNRCMVYKTKSDGTIDLSETIETYIFTDKGYLYIDHIEQRIVFTFYNSNDIINIDYEDSKNSTDIQSLDILYKKINNKYVISQDDVNILKSMSYSNENSSLIEYSHYENVNDEDSLYRYTIHPLIIDLFDLSYISTDIFKYWVLEKYIVEKDGEEPMYIREIYEIKDQLSLEQLLNILNSNVLNKIF